jgi:single-strand DNA-binding protein
MNNIIIHGRLVREPETNYFNEGKCITKLVVAVDRRFNDKDGNKVSDFFNCVCFGKQAEIIDKYFGKGDGIVLRGEMQNSKYTDKDGNPRDFWQLKIDAFEFPLGKKSNSVAVESVADIDFTTGGSDEEDLPFI